jgi:hypothetical protein
LGPVATMESVSAWDRRAAAPGGIGGAHGPAKAAVVRGTETPPAKPSRVPSLGASGKNSSDRQRDRPRRDHAPRVGLLVYMVARVLYFVPGDRERLDCVRAAQPSLEHPDERFMLDAPTPAYAPHRSVTADPYFKPLSGVRRTAAHLYGHDNPVDVGIHEVAAWWLARELGPPWSQLVAPTVWFDPPDAEDIGSCGPVILGMGGYASLPQPGVGFDRLISDAAFFDAVIGAQDRHDHNLRAEMPPRLALIDHGYAFARTGDWHNPYEAAGLFLKIRFGERHFRVPDGPALDYSGVGPLSPALGAHEQAAIGRLAADRDLLGVAQLLSDDRAQALRDRVARMAGSGEVLQAADF